jgi:hypothetical protein
MCNAKKSLVKNFASLLINGKSFLPLNFVGPKERLPESRAFIEF